MLIALIVLIVVNAVGVYAVLHDMGLIRFVVADQAERVKTLEIFVKALNQHVLDINTTLREIKKSIEKTP